MTGRPLVLTRRPRARIGDVVRVVDRREKRWLIRRVGHEVGGDPRPAIVAVLAAAMLFGRWMIPLAKGMPFARGTTVTTGLLILGGVLAVIAVGWWARIAQEALLQHLLVLRRCGRCAHPSPDRGPLSGVETPFACRSWRCTECGSEWVGAGRFPDAETRRDAA
ncbi:MAG: hypothetical protein RLZZ461_161 [Planctomycetota bacterium]